MRRIAIPVLLAIFLLQVAPLAVFAEAEKSIAGGWEKLLPGATHAKFQSIVYNHRLGEKDGYEKQIRELVAIDPKNSLVLTCAAGLAGLYGDLDLGNELSKAAVEADPLQPKAWGVRGEILYHRGKFTEAIEAYTNAIDFGSGDSVAERYYMRGLSYSHHELKLLYAKFALVDMEKARKLNDRADWMFAHTTVLYETLRMNDALTLLDAYVKRMPDDPQGAIMRAMTLIVLDRSKEADEEFARLKKLDSKRAEREPMIRENAATAKIEYNKLKKLAKDASQLLKQLQPLESPKN